MSLKDYPGQESYGRRGYVVLNASSVENIPLAVALKHDEYLIIRDCPFCPNEARIVVPAQGLWDWEHGLFVQVAMPNLTPENREMVMTGTHPACFDRIFADE